MAPLTQQKQPQSNSGFTLLEVLVALAIIAALVAIVAPGWLGLLNRQRMNTAQNAALAVIREAQANAKRQNRQWQACFRVADDRVQSLAQALPSRSTPTSFCATDAPGWEDLIGGESDQVAINTATTSFLTNGPGVYYVPFRFDGLIDDERLGAASVPTRISFQPREGATPANQRCVAVATLLGAIRTERGPACNL
ncbi:prepilin-type N-terminal cleavage/methylation domain-containing protein [Leptolyngbya sp. FACHB-261]|uniref:prepilin-type N-terminal cleavage/methylation domain-containing protein n=1 Tax=Leptolyngbya sp. FACHB-261 TaxID=2692806 RepID=UPI001686CDCE|nr:prepilin-type N-terminal cleavage/methylation domain-containing protein [Leptolyngbya sp. FACHB-261]MBD2100727.1 prepilin-type N-terminal cleavage/methylation domain-containing protein [Leptolyngbya sp. FACHB-261]